MTSQTASRYFVVYTDDKGAYEYECADQADYDRRMAALNARFDAGGINYVGSRTVSEPMRASDIRASLVAASGTHDRVREAAQAVGADNAAFAVAMLDATESDLDELAEYEDSAREWNPDECHCPWPWTAKSCAYCRAQAASPAPVSGGEHPSSHSDQDIASRPESRPADVWSVTVDCLLSPAEYPTRKDAAFALGVDLQSAPVGTVAAVWRNAHLRWDDPDRKQTDAYNVRRSKAKGVHIDHRTMD